MVPNLLSLYLLGIAEEVSKKWAHVIGDGVGAIKRLGSLRTLQITLD